MKLYNVADKFGTRFALYRNIKLLNENSTMIAVPTALGTIAILTNKKIKIMEYVIDTDEKATAFLEFMEMMNPELKEDIRNGKIDPRGQTIEFYGL